MVGNDPQGYIAAFGFAIRHAGDPADVLHDVLDRIHLKEVVHPLHDAGQAFQTHAGVDVGMLQGSVIPFAVVVELGEHQVPELDIAVAVAAYAAGRGPAAVGLAPVKIDFRAGAAGAGPVLPEIVLLAQADDPGGIHAHLLRPDVERLIVVLINRDPEAVHRQFQHLRAEFPCPGRRLVLEIIAEAEIAQHLEVGAVAGGFSHPFDIGGPDALLAGGHPLAGRRDLAGEKLFIGAIPELISSRDLSFCGTSEKLGRRRCPLLS